VAVSVGMGVLVSVEVDVGMGGHMSIELLTASTRSTTPTTSFELHAEQFPRRSTAVLGRVAAVVPAAKAILTQVITSAVLTALLPSQSPLHEG
jgi:hypothetical protein